MKSETHDGPVLEKAAAKPETANIPVDHIPLSNGRSVWVNPDKPRKEPVTADLHKPFLLLTYEEAREIGYGRNVGPFSFLCFLDRETGEVSPETYFPRRNLFIGAEYVRWIRPRWIKNNRAHLYTDTGHYAIKFLGIS